MMVCGLLRVRASTHWLGMGQSVHRYFLMASYLSFRELDKIQTTFEEKKNLCKKLHSEHYTALKEFFRKKLLTLKRNIQMFTVKEGTAKCQCLYLRTKGSYPGHPCSVLGLHRRMSSCTGDSQEPRVEFLRANPTKQQLQRQIGSEIMDSIHTMFVSGVILCCKTLK